MVNNTVDNITEDIANDMEFILSEIKECSKYLHILKTLFSLIYDAGMKWRVFIKNTATSPAGPNGKGYVKRWLKEIKKNIIYKACVDTAAVNWKSHIQLKLMGE